MFFLSKQSCLKSIIILVLFFVVTSSHAVDIDVPKKPFNLATAPGRGMTIRNVPAESITVTGFKRGEVRKHLMLAHGPEYINIKYQTTSSFLGSLGNNYCKLKNTEVSNPRDYEAKAAYFKKQSDVMRMCLQYRVTDHGQLPIRYVSTQPDCKIEKVDSHTVVATGGLCYFQINRKSSFSVRYELNPKCSDMEYLKWNNIDPMDFFIFSGFYIAGDASGHSMDLTPLDAAKIRLTVEPWGDSLPMSIPYPFSPMWPTRVSTDYHMGNVRIFKNNDRKRAQVVEASLIASNLCGRSCNGPNCASVCDFHSVLGAEMKLYELNSAGEPLFLDLWYAGGMVPAQWEGFLPTSRVLQFDAIVPGRRYRVEASLSYPDMYYRLFKKGFEQLLIDLSTYKNGYSLTGGGRSLPTLTPLEPLRSSNNQLPLLKPYRGLTSANGLADIWTALDTLNNQFHIVGWPPFYEEYSRNGKTRNILDGSNEITISMDFTVKEFEPNKEAVLSDFVIRRSSNTLRNYSKRLDKQPYIDCTAPLQPWE